MPRRRAWRRGAFQLAGWVALLVVLRLVVIPAESSELRQPEELRASSTAAREWIERNLQPDGRYLYVYDADLDDVPNDYNEVRHAGVTMALFQSAGRDGDVEAVLTRETLRSSGCSTACTAATGGRRSLRRRATAQSSAPAGSCSSRSPSGGSPRATPATTR